MDAVVMRFRTIVVAAVAAGVMAGLGAWWLSAARAAERREAVESSLVRSWARAEAGAGMSTTPKRVPGASWSTLRELRDLPGFRDYAMRCSSCHVLPDPGAREARGWYGVVERMRHHINRSGAMPPPEMQMESTLDFLRSAAERRTSP
jgi:hypothetical protein